MKPIQAVFLAIEKGDSALLHTAFFKDVSLTTVLDKEGKITLRKESLQDFLNAVGSPHQEKWYEPIWNVNIQQDGSFAHVWAKYAFFVGTKFSHCGIDAFQLVKTAEGWKIFYLTDTRNRTGCQVPDAITKQYTQAK